MHGLVQSQAQAAAARELSAAKAALENGLYGAQEAYEAAYLKHRKALQEYIDPFKLKYAW